jgi:outer membrane receptor for ferric coprogen and ferric-rhodotorulic acid
LGDRSILAAGLAAALAGTGIPAEAQDGRPEDGGDVILDTIEVRGPGGGLAAGTTEGTGLYTAPATNTATKFALTPRETPQTVTVVPEQVIEDFHLTDMREVLETAPFVNVQSERNNGVFFPQARGGEYLNIQFDGMPGPADIGLQGALPLDTAIFDRIEILYGAQGLLAGYGTAGGVINLVRKMPTADFQASGQASLDTDGGYRLVGDASGPLNEAGTVRGRFVAVYDYDGSFIDYAWTRWPTLYGVVEADVSDTTTVAAGAMWTEYTSSMGPAYGMPTLPDGSFLDLPRSANLSADWARDRRKGWTAFAKLDQALPGDWELRGSLSLFRSEARLLSAIPQGPFDPDDDYSFIVEGQREGWDADIYSLDTYATGPARLFGREHELMIGLNGARTENSSIDGRLRPDPLQVSHAFDHDPTAVPQEDPGSWPVVWPASESTLDQYGIFAGGRFSLSEPVHLILGARAGSYSYEDAATSFDTRDVTPYAAVTWDFSEWGTVYASYARIYSPNIWYKGADGSLLDPQQGHNYEAGVKGSFFGGALDASLALYRLQQKNVPQEDYAGGMICDGWYCYVPSGEIVTNGVDVGLSGAIRPGWNVLAGYSYAASDYDDTGEPAFTNFPEHQFKLSTTYDLPGDRWTVGGQVRYQSRIYNEGEEEVPYRVEQPGYAVFDLMAQYRLTEKASLLLSVDNLFDKTYYNGISYPRHGQTFGPPRTTTLTLMAAF